MPTSRPASDTSRFRWPVVGQRVFGAPAERVWSVISTPGALEAYHPFCKANPVETWPGAASRDAIRYQNGVLLERRFTDWAEAAGFDLEIWGRGVKTALVSWRLEAVDPESSRLTVTVTPDLTPRLPLAVRWLLHRLRVAPALGKYLRQVLEGLDWYVTTGNPVRPDQFGRHPWFSQMR